MRVGGPLEGRRARGPQGPKLACYAGAAGAPPARRPRMILFSHAGDPPLRAQAPAPLQAPALGGQAGIPLGQTSLAWWLAPCGPLAAACCGGTRDKARSSDGPQDHGPRA